MKKGQGSFNKFSEEFLPVISRGLAELLPSPSRFTGDLNRALEYSVKTGGKKIRPLLFLAATLAAGKKIPPKKLAKLVSFACGIEFIHNYSLIHDDIMDGDNTRRGYPTVHKKFGVNVAILAGDALLTGGLKILYENFPEPAGVLNASIFVPGMISGQAADMQYEKKLSKQALRYIHKNKTAAFFSGICRSAARAMEQKKNIVELFAVFGENLGMGFQIMDDLLDRFGKKSEFRKTRTDGKNRKLTALSFYSASVCRRQINDFAAKAGKNLSALPGDTGVLSDITGVLSMREK
ncbi:MAG: polyprenyl synthetase family protein [bacterium]